MLFNSYEFIFLFFPLCALGFFCCARFFTLNTALGFLVFASLGFYAYWKPAYLILLLFSIGFNFAVGQVLSRENYWRRRSVLIFGISVNLALLGYFKYANFFVDNVNTVFGTHWDVGTIFLPLAISFFTFQQISYLVDAWQGKTHEYNFLHYALFVCFFPQLIAGPIVHHRDIIPQFMKPGNLTPRWSNFAVGMSIFAIGLFKKTVIADSLSTYVGPVYDTGGAGGNIDFFRAWGSSLAYTFQLYFDFSGYSDMAIGAARVFGVRLPVNFFSPYKSTSIIEFWRRWHMTLSQFLRDYLYIALGGNRKGKYRRYLNLFLTMLLGGLWHGAGWPFVVWGALHGGYLMVNHSWRHMLSRFGWNVSSHPVYMAFAWGLTFLAVVFSWVYFRAPTLEHGNQIAMAMLGFSGFEVPAGILARLGDVGSQLTAIGVVPVQGGGTMILGNYLWVLAVAPVALLLPNVAQIFCQHEPVLYENDRAFRALRSSDLLSWDYSTRWAVAIALAGVAGILTLQQVSEFLYFQF
ncbi:MAG: MBOAT family protein [Halioglobus sp.]|nr:MBOAT family protein [Halioglobus sp.]